MAIYKLAELYLKKPEYGIGASAKPIGKYKYVRQTDISGNIFPTYVDEGPLLNNNDILISRAGANSGATYLHEMGEGYVFAGFLVRYNFNQNKIRNKYFYYWTKSNNYINQIKNLSNSGSTMPKLNPPVVGSMKINLPSLKTQQEIIDIIKPIEDAINLNRLLLSNIKKQEGALLYFSSPTKQLFEYHKGGLPDNDGDTLFLNVASANGNPNRYVSNEANIFLGDVTLSLDGNCGLVNNTLHGYNGYLYKVTAENIPNWQIYYSLKTSNSQNIIKLNETGTTIKHSTGSKKELKVHNFEYAKLLENLFEQRIYLHEINTHLNNTLNNIVQSLIK